MIEKLAQYPLKNFQVNFVGGGEPLENERRRAKELGLEGRSVFYLGVVADVYQELARADFYLSASIVEGMPIAVLEAILSGLPAILPDIPEFKKFSSKSVYLYDRESSQGMVDAIKSFIDGYDEVSAAAIESAMKMRRSYSIETCAENHERLYASLVNG